MSRDVGVVHGLAYDAEKKIIYEVNHPANQHGFVHWIEGTLLGGVPINGINFDDTKSVAYQWNLGDKKRKANFWEREKDSKFLLAPVSVPNPAAATAWFQAHLGKPWDYNFFTNNCAHYSVQGLNAGGAGIDFTGPRPASFPIPFTMSWSAGSQVQFQ